MAAHLVQREPIGSFSALQRAENSSIPCAGGGITTIFPFQCSSASRKFLNRLLFFRLRLFRRVSVLFSEPKIPQSARIARPRRSSSAVSVLFSEPKIPQSAARQRVI